MKDFCGRELAVGDNVLAIRHYYNHTELSFGKILRIPEQSQVPRRSQYCFVYIQTSQFEGYESSCFGYEIFLIDDETVALTSLRH